MMIEADRELKNLIRRITEEVIRRILEPEKAEQGTLVLVPSFVTDKEPLNEYLKEKYAGVVCAGEDAFALGEASQVISIDTRPDQQRLMSSLKQYADIVLYAPPLWMLRNIAAGDDRGFFEQAFMRALLWEKKASVVLDFDKPKFRRGTFFEELSDALGAIEDMGAEIVSLKLSVGRPECELPLVTEAKVIDAHKAGKERIRCAQGAIVTPLARDTAKELGVSIEEWDPR